MGRNGRPNQSAFPHLAASGGCCREAVVPTVSIYYTMTGHTHNEAYVSTDQTQILILHCNILFRI